MGSREITELRKSGNLDAALTLALKEHASAPEDSYIKSALAWVYRDMLKTMEDANKFSEFSKVLNKVLSLEIDLKYENYLCTALRWNIIKLGWKLIEADKKKTFRLKQLLEMAINVPAVNSNENSVLVKMFVKAFKDDRKCYYQLVDWQKFDHFVQNSEQDDYASKVYNDREILSLVESYFRNYCKHLLPENFSGQVMFDVNRVDEVISHCAKLILKHPEYKRLPYYIAQLQSARGNGHEALKTILPSVRTHRNHFWAWERLGDILPDPKDKLSCYCKGAQCKNKAEMLIGLRNKLIPFFIEYSELGAAKYEIEQIIHIRNRQEWTVPQALIEWQNAEWFSSSESRINNVSTYEKYSVNAEELLYGDIDSQDVLILWKDDHKQLAGFLANDEKCGTGIFRGDIVNKLEEYNVYKVKLLVNNKGTLEPLTKPLLVVNQSFREKHIMKKNIIILWVDREKNLAGFLFEDEIKTSTNSGVLRDDFSREVVAYDTYSLEVMKNQKGGYEVISKPIKNINEKLRNEFVEPIEGSVRIGEDKKFGFISDFYIPPRLVQKYLLYNGNQVKGFIVRNWNSKEKVWSWQLGDIDGTEIR